MLFLRKYLWVHRNHSSRGSFSDLVVQAPLYPLPNSFRFHTNDFFGQGYTYYTPETQFSSLRHLPPDNIIERNPSRIDETGFLGDILEGGKEFLF
jgi:hypothetical protein